MHVLNEDIYTIDKLIRRDKSKGLDESFSKCLCACQSDAINCYSYCLKVIKEYLKISIKPPSFLIPDLGLTIKVKKIPIRFPFLLFSQYTDALNDYKNNIEKITKMNADGDDRNLSDYSNDRFIATAGEIRYVY